MKKIRAFLPLLFAITIVHAQKSNYKTIGPDDTEQEIIEKAANVVPTPRQLHWQQLELTAFFHFGVNTFTNKEWGDGTEDEKIFNPEKLDANEWVSACKKTGIRLVILTVRHHDGFCLWPSKYTEHSVKNSPWKNGKGDVVKEVAEACKKQHMGFGIYLSPWDRHSKLYGSDAYNDYFVNQLTELLSNYGRIDEVWFDGANGEGPNGKKQTYDFDRWYKVIRTLQPQAVIANMGPDVRWVGTESGYGREQEWSVVPVGALSTAAIAARSQTSIDIKFPGDMTGDVLGSRAKIETAKALAWYPAETDVSIRPGWFYHQKEDSEVKTPEKLMDIYYNSVGKNSVLLLNIPPDKDGLLNDADVKSLLGWRALRDSVFKNNLLKNAVIQIPAALPNSHPLVDGNVLTGITLTEKGGEYTVQWKLDKPHSFHILLLQEEIAKGQRVESFILEGLRNGNWEKITEGSTIGYKRILLFDPFMTRQIRLRITSSRLRPNLAEMGLY